VEEVSFKFGKASMKRLAECDPRLQKIAFELIKEMDVLVLCGHRGEKEQNEAFNLGNSKKRWPNSKHNKLPSLAVDLAPYPLSWSNIKRFKDMCKRIERIAEELNIKIKLGRDFSFKDYPHVELVDG
jgi:peptidoglycan LD-endopeptidase CwlK